MITVAGNVKRVLLFASVLVLFSCTLRHKDKKAEKKDSVKSAKDTVSLLARVRSYEPAKYKGKVPKDYYTFYGMYDWWRFPLVYPYAITCIDVIENGGMIVNDFGKTDLRAGGSVTPQSDYFDKFFFNKDYFVGNLTNDPFRRDEPPPADKYFVFSFSNGKITNISGRENLNKKLQEVKFTGDTTFITLREYYKNL